MKWIAVFLCSLILAAAAVAQSPPQATAAPPAAPAAQDWVAQSITKHAWELGFVAGGGTGLGKSDTTQFAFGGARGGLILTGNHLPGILRGNFEWAVEVLPLYAVLPPSSGVYGASVRPAFGTYMFVKPRSAFSFEATFGHLSNASIGAHNPGYNATFLFTVGYSWFKGGR